MDACINLADIEALAREKLAGSTTWDFYEGGAEDEDTVTENCAAFRRIKLRPRVLVDVAARDLSTEILGQLIALPVLLGPTTYQWLAHPDAEIASAHAAAAAGTIFVVPTEGHYSVRAITEGAPGPLWFQLYTFGGRDQRHLLILDELPYAAESDSAMLSSLQHAWDRHFQHSQVVIVICGSHVRTMELLFGRQSPLFGRMTGQWRLLPLPFGTLNQFLPTWSPEELVATYAIVGGVPAYLAWLDPAQTLVENIKQVMLAPGSLVLAEAMFLLQDEVREPRNYLAILQAIGGGAHSLSEIANASMISTTHLSSYLAQLHDLRLVERRLPATVPTLRQQRSRMGRYHLSDPFLRFHFRFLEPYAAEGLLSYQPERVLPAIQRELRAFVGSTAWEELARQWTLAQRATDALGFTPEVVGSHWSRTVQIDVIAINWQTHDILLGECKWGADAVDRKIVRELIEKAPLVLADLPNAGANWRVQYALFTRAGATPAARQELAAHQGIVVDLARLHDDLTVAAAGHTA